MLDKEFAKWMDGDVFMGSHFNIARQGDKWMIWRLADDEGTREYVTFDQHGMDDLRDYFADFYTEDRAEGREKVAAECPKCSQPMQHVVETTDSGKKFAYVMCTCLLIAAKREP